MGSHNVGVTGQMIGLCGYIMAIDDEALSQDQTHPVQSHFPHDVPILQQIHECFYEPQNEAVASL